MPPGHLSPDLSPARGEELGTGDRCPVRGYSIQGDLGTVHQPPSVSFPPRAGEGSRERFPSHPFPKTDLLGLVIFSLAPRWLPGVSCLRCPERSTVGHDRTNATYQRRSPTSALFRAIRKPSANARPS